MSSHINIAIVEDHEEIRTSLGLLLNGTPGFVCEFQFESAEAAADGLVQNPVDVVLMDIDLPGMNGIKAVQGLKPKLPDTEFVMLTVHRDDDAIFGSLCAGASGYLVKDSPPIEILKALEEVHQGGSPMSSSIARRVLKSFRPNEENPLSEREREILKLLTEGLNYKAVADDLFISPLTVKSHIKNIYSKLHVNSRAEAVKRALNDNLL